MNPCQQFKEMIFDLLDHQVDSQRKKHLYDHLSECPQCEKFFSRCKALKARLSSLEQIRASDTFHILLRERLRREAAGNRRWIRPVLPGYMRWAPAVGVVALAVFIGVLVTDRGTPLQEGEYSEIRASASGRDPFQGPVQFVIDDYPQRIAVARDDRSRSGTITGPDSLRPIDRVESERPRVTPVSF